MSLAAMADAILLSVIPVLTIFMTSALVIGVFWLSGQGSEGKHGRGENRDQGAEQFHQAHTTSALAGDFGRLKKRPEQIEAFGGWERNRPPLPIPPAPNLATG